MIAAWGFTWAGAKVLLHLMAGSKEDAETVTACIREELDQEYEARNGLASKPSANAPDSKLSSKSRT